MYDRTALVMAADRLAAEDEERRRYLDREIAREPRSIKIHSPEPCRRGHVGHWRAKVSDGVEVRYCVACIHVEETAERRRKAARNGR